MQEPDIRIPVNRVGIVRLVLVDRSASYTMRRLESVEWSLDESGARHFSLTISADGLSGEIRPISVGDGAITIVADPGHGDPAISATRTVMISEGEPDWPHPGELPCFIGTVFSVVPEIGRQAAGE